MQSLCSGLCIIHEPGFNTASGIGLHAINRVVMEGNELGAFQYRKRYRAACNQRAKSSSSEMPRFQYRKRYRAACNLPQITIAVTR